uniref:Uncharacterized protein n=1 Tax=viral metagenome TaxID=1070528 RepID=A0A6M3X477_9ZZZZ
MSIPDQLKQDRIKELKERQEQDKRELALLTGHRGPCSGCGEEGGYASQDSKLCHKCWNEKRIAEKRPEYEHLIGLKVVDVIISATWHYPLRGFKLEDGYAIEVESDYDGDAYLDLTKNNRRLPRD